MFFNYYIKSTHTISAASLALESDFGSLAEKSKGVSEASILPFKPQTVPFLAFAVDLPLDEDDDEDDDGDTAPEREEGDDFSFLDLTPFLFKMSAMLSLELEGDMAGELEFGEALRLANELSSDLGEVGGEVEVGEVVELLVGLKVRVVISFDS